MGMKYCKRKIPRLWKFLLKVVISFPVIRENKEERDNEMWSVERSSYTTLALDRFFLNLRYSRILSALSTGIDCSI